MEPKKTIQKKSTKENENDEKMVLDLFLQLSIGVASILIGLLYLSSETFVNSINE